MEISLKEHWKKIVQAEMDARMQKLKEFIESRSSKEGVNQESRRTIDFSSQFHYELCATAPKNCYGVNFGQLVLDYQGRHIVLWEWNQDTYFLPYARVDEDIAELRCPDCRFLKFRRLTLSALVEYLRQMPQIAEKAVAVRSRVASFYSEEEKSCPDF